MMFHETHQEKNIQKPIAYSQKKNKQWTICCFSAQLH